ncbi:MAG: DUF2206 domain-containing protein [Chloroflexi bacterium]|nr:DUF2206 domain-containing protein [Chloroflexota bacterium]
MVEKASPLNINDWDISKFLQAVLVVSLITLGLLGLYIRGLDVPVLRQVFGFVFLAFIPGAVILRILRLHKLNLSEAILYSVGLSMAFVMIVGLFANGLYPLMGISQPLSTLPVIVTFSGALLILCILGYLRDRDFSSPAPAKAPGIPLSPTLFLLLIPVLSLLGVYLLNFNGNNSILLLLFVLIAAVPALIAFGKFIPESLYPFAAWAISLSLLLQSAMLSDYLVPTGDVEWEMVIAGLVTAFSYWNPVTPDATNSMLSVTTFPPIFSIVSGLSLAWVFKLIYPLLFSLLPLGIYRVFARQTSAKVAFLAVFFFMSFAPFFTILIAQAKQEFAELFMVLVILLMLSGEIARLKRAILMIIFGFGVAVSHYGTSYIFMFLILPVLLLFPLLENRGVANLLQGLRERFVKSAPGLSNSDPPSSNPGNNTVSVMKALTGNFILLYMVFALAWYIYTTSSAPFSGIVGIGKNISESIYTEFFQRGTREPEVLMAYGLEEPQVKSIQRYAGLGMQYVTQLLVFIGAFRLLRKREGFSREYLTMVMISMVVLVLAIVLPYFSAAMNMSRLTHLVFIILAPLIIVGGETVFQWVSRLFEPVSLRLSSVLRSHQYEFLTLFVLVPNFMFYTGFVYEVTGDVPTSRSLSYEAFSYALTNKTDLAASDWVMKNVVSPSNIYTDYYGRPPFSRFVHAFIARERINEISPTSQYDITANDYVFIRQVNVATDKIWFREDKVRVFPLSETAIDKLKNKVYNNGYSAVYR